MSAPVTSRLRSGRRRDSRPQRTGEPAGVPACGADRRPVRADPGHDSGGAGRQRRRQRRVGRPVRARRALRQRRRRATSAPPGRSASVTRARCVATTPSAGMPPPTPTAGWTPAGWYISWNSARTWCWAWCVSPTGATIPPTSPTAIVRAYERRSRRRRPARTHSRREHGLQRAGVLAGRRLSDAGLRRGCRPGRRGSRPPATAFTGTPNCRSSRRRAPRRGRHTDSLITSVNWGDRRRVIACDGGIGTALAGVGTTRVAAARVGTHRRTLATSGAAGRGRHRRGPDRRGPCRRRRDTPRVGRQAPGVRVSCGAYGRPNPPTPC